MDKETHYVFLFGYNDINSAKESEQFPRIFFEKLCGFGIFFYLCQRSGKDSLQQQKRYAPNL